MALPVRVPKLLGQTVHRLQVQEAEKRAQEALRLVAVCSRVVGALAVLLRHAPEGRMGLPRQLLQAPKDAGGL